MRKIIFTFSLLAVALVSAAQWNVTIKGSLMTNSITLTGKANEWEVSTAKQGENLDLSGTMATSTGTAVIILIHQTGGNWVDKGTYGLTNLTSPLSTTYNVPASVPASTTLAKDHFYILKFTDATSSSSVYSPLTVVPDGTPATVEFTWNGAAPVAEGSETPIGEWAAGSTLPIGYTFNKHYDADATSVSAKLGLYKIETTPSGNAYVFIKGWDAQEKSVSAGATSSSLDYVIPSDATPLIDLPTEQFYLIQAAVNYGGVGLIANGNVIITAVGTSVDELGAESVSVYPNPVASGNDVNVGGAAVIKNIAGVVVTEGVDVISTAGLTSGIYIVVTEAGSTKLVIE